MDREVSPLIIQKTSSQWTTQDPFLAKGDIGVESDTGSEKIGVGLKWSATSYKSNPASDVSGLATVATSGAYSDLSGAPTSMTPTSHASTHQTGGADFVARVVNSPTSIGADQDDYALPAADIVRLDASAAYNITGFVAGADGVVRVLVNIGSHDITIKHQSASSAAANRVQIAGGVDCVLPTDGAATIVYDATASRWRVVGRFA